MICSTTEVQRDAIERFERLRVGALFLQQGSGKSRVAIDLINYNADRVDQVIWVAPFSVKATIQAEVAKWGAARPVEVVGFETLSGSDAEYLRVLKRARAGRLFLVVDESIFVKNADAKRTQRVRALRKHADYVLILNGSPVVRDLWDLKRQIDLLDPRIIGMSDSEFRSRYFTQVRYRKSTGEKGEFEKVYQPNVAHLMGLVDPYMVMADLRLGVGETQREHQHAPSAEVRDEYERVKKRTLDRWAADGGGDLVRVLTYLNALTGCDPVKVTSVAEHIGGKCVVFTTWLDETRLLAEQLRTPYVVTGATTGRADVLAAWEADDQPLVMTVGTGAFGLNLQAAHVVHFASQTFDYGRMQQAYARARRLGQTRDLVHHYHYSTLGIASLIRANLDTKDVLARLVRREIDLEKVL